MRAGAGIAAWVWTMLVSSAGSAAELAEPVEEYVQVREHRDAAEKSWQRVTIAGLPDGGGYAAYGNGDGGDGGEAQTELWTFADSGLGQARARARIALSNARDARGEMEWAAFLGAGHGIVPGEARLYVLFIDRGIDGWAGGDFVSIATGAPAPVNDAEQPLLSNGLGEPALVDTDLDGSADLAYAGDLQGNLYRFDISGSDPSSWRAVRLFQASYGSPLEAHQPITQRPFAIMHPRDDEFLVVFGTGRDLAGENVDSTDIQSIYGIWDPGEPDPATARAGARSDRLVRRVLVNVVEESAGSFATRRILTGEPVNYARDAPGRPGVYGWFIDLDMPRAMLTLQGNSNPDPCGRAPPHPQYPGERVVGRPVPRGKVLFMATGIPGDAAMCADAPRGSVLAIDTITGGSLEAGAFDLNDDGRFDAGFPLGPAPETPVSGIVLDGGVLTETPVEPELASGSDGSTVLVVGAGGDAVTLDIGTAGEPRTGRLSWREITDVEP